MFYKGFTCSGSEGNILECSNEIDETLSSCGSTGTIVGLLCTGAGGVDYINNLMASSHYFRIITLQLQWLP